MLVKACTALIFFALLFGVNAQLCHAQNSAGVQQLADKLAAAKTEAEWQSLLTSEKELGAADQMNALIQGIEKLRVKGNFESALTLAHFTHAVAERMGDPKERGRALQSLGNAYQDRGEYDAALGYYEKGLPLMKAANYQRGVAASTVNMGLIYRLQGDFDKALELYRQGLAINEQAQYKTGIANTLNLIGVVYRLRGNGALALESFQKAQALFVEDGFESGVTGMLNNIGALYLQQGQYEQAEQSFRKSLERAEKLKYRPQMAQALNNIGRTYRFRSENAKALDYIKQSLAIREEIGDKAGVARTLGNIAEIYSDETLREYQLALDNYQRSLALFESLGNKKGVAEATTGIAQLFLSRGDYKTSLEWSARALPLARETDKDDLWQVLANAGAAHRGLKQLDQAKASFVEAIAVIEEMRADVAGGEQERQRFLEVNISPYQALIEVLVEQKDWDGAFAYAEQAKGRVLLDVLRSGRTNVAKAMTAAERTEEQQLRSELVSLNYQLTREGQGSKPNSVRLSDLKSRLQKARLGYEGFQTNLYAAHQELRVQRGELRPISLKEAGALLPNPRTALLEYVVGQDQTFLFVFTKGKANRSEPNFKVYTLNVTREDLAEQSERFRRQLAQRDLTYGETARRLYDLFLKPAEAQLRGIDSLVIVPDGKLWDLPFQALQDDGSRHLIESYAISYAPSLAVLREMIQTGRKAPASSSVDATLLAVGNPTLGQETIRRAKPVLMDDKLDPLPEAEKQVKALGKLYGAARSRVYVGAEAREGRVKTEAGDYRILQLATHGVVNDISPMYSHVLLSQEEGNLAEDGLLEAWELMNLDLKADLVVLSACETARGRVGAGEGVIGLTWALFVAGSPTTVVSQWKVEAASTTELMLEFHRNLRGQTNGAARGMSTSIALQRAAQKMVGSKAHGHPFYWAGFVVVGDGR